MACLLLLQPDQLLVPVVLLVLSKALHVKYQPVSLGIALQVKPLQSTTTRC